MVARSWICRRVLRRLASSTDPSARVAGPLARPLPLADSADDDSPMVHGGWRHLSDIRAGYLDGNPADPSRLRVLRDLLRLRRSLLQVRRPVRSRRRSMVAPALDRARRHPAVGNGRLPEQSTGPTGYALAWLPSRLLSVFLQAAYPWLLTFGLMGLIRRVCPVESPRMRYFSPDLGVLALPRPPAAHHRGPACRERLANPGLREVRADRRGRDLLLAMDVPGHGAAHLAGTIPQWPARPTRAERCGWKLDRVE